MNLVGSFVYKIRSDKHATFTAGVSSICLNRAHNSEVGSKLG